MNKLIESIKSNKVIWSTLKVIFWVGLSRVITLLAHPVLGLNEAVLNDLANVLLFFATTAILELKK